MRKILIVLGILMFMLLNLNFVNKKRKKKKKESYTVYVIPTSNEVTAGAEYEADIITFLPKGIVPTITTNVGEVSWEEGVAKVIFTPFGARYDKYGEVQKFWEAYVSFAKVKGQDTTITIKTNYRVKRAQVNVFCSNALYRNCGNSMRINMPALGEDYNPEFNSQDAKIVKTKRKGDIIIFPYKSVKKVAVSIRNNGVLIGVETFKVKSVPQPKVIVKLNDKYLDNKLGYGNITKGVVSIKIRPEMNFASTLPKESKYQVTKWSATLVRNGRPITTPTFFSTSSQDLSSLFSQSKPNDRILIEVSEISRRTSFGTSEKVPFGIEYFNILIN